MKELVFFILDLNEDRSLSDGVWPNPGQSGQAFDSNAKNLSQRHRSAHLVARRYAKFIVGDVPLLGPLLENFVLAELQKQIGWSEIKPRLFHWRTASNQEVDFVLEDDRGRLVGIEVKATASLGANHLLGLRALAESAGKRFVRGVVLYTGKRRCSVRCKYSRHASVRVVGIECLKLSARAWHYNFLF